MIEARDKVGECEDIRPGLSELRGHRFSANRRSEAPGSREERRPGLPARVGEAIWSNLPLLLVMDGALFVAALPAAALFFFGGSLLAPLAAALALGPVWAGSVASADRMIRDEAVHVRDFAESVRQYAWRGISVSLVPAVVATAALGTLAILESTGERWLLAPLFADGSVSILVFLAGFSVFSLATTGGLRGWALWRASLEVAAADPMATLGSVAILILLGFLVSVVPGILPVLPAPLAVYLSAATWATIERERERGGSS